LQQKLEKGGRGVTYDFANLGPSFAAKAAPFDCAQGSGLRPSARTMTRLRRGDYCAAQLPRSLRIGKASSPLI